jgi:ribonuclease HII
MKEPPLLEMLALKPDFSFEDGYKGIVCGIDEVGRGPLAGPVVAAAVVIRRKEMPTEVLAGINDSKKLTAAKRARLFMEIHRYSHVALGLCTVEEIDRVNILQASLLAMTKAYDKLQHRLGEAPVAALVDGNQPPSLPRVKVRTIIKGDARSFSIAAASIVAKHYRDRLMCRYAGKFPHYGWDRNAGYGTREHLKAIQIHGVTQLHRRSFSPVAHKLDE